MALSDELKKMIESNAGRYDGVMDTRFSPGGMTARREDVPERFNLSGMMDRIGGVASNVIAGRPLGAIASMAGGGGQEQRPSIPQTGFAAPIGTTPPMIGGGSAMGAQPSLPEGVNLMESNLPTKNIGGRRNPQTGEMEGGIPIAPDFNQAYQGVDGGFYARRETEDGGFENFQMRPEQYEQFEFSPGDPNTVTQQIDGGSVTYPKGFEPAQPDPNNVAGSGFSQEELRQRALERTQFRLGQAAMDAGRMAELGMTPGFAGAEDPKMRGDFGSMREVGASSISLQPSPMERNRMAAARFAENSGALGRGRPVGAAAQEGVMRMDEARRLAGGDRDAARAIQERQRQGLDPMTGERIEPAETERIPAAEQKVQRIMEAYPDMSRSEAISLADGVIRIQSDPVTGNTMLVNTATGEGRQIQLSDEQQTQQIQETLRPEEGASPESQSLYDMANSQTTGVFPFIRSAVQGVSGQVGVNVADPEVQEAVQYITAQQNDLIRALSINPRFPVGEIDRIRKEVNITPGALTDPQTMSAKMRGVDKALRVRLQNEMEASKDESLSIQNRRDARQAAKDIGNFLRILGVPQEDKEGASNAPEGVEQELWDVMTEQERQLWQN